MNRLTLFIDSLTPLEKMIAVLFPILMFIYSIIYFFPDWVSDIYPRLPFYIFLWGVLLSTLIFFLASAAVAERVMIKHPKAEGYEKELEEYIKNIIIGVSGGTIVLLLDDLESATPSELLSLETVGFTFALATFTLTSVLIISTLFLIYANMDIQS